MNVSIYNILDFFSKIEFEKRSLLKNASKSFIIKIIGAGLAFGVNILLARLLGVQDYGAYIYIYSWVAVFIIFIPLGFDKSLLRFIPEYKYAEKWKGLKGILLLSFKSVLILSLVIFLLNVVIIFKLDSTKWKYSKQLILTGAAVLPILGLLTINSKALVGFRKISKALIPKIIIAQIITAIVVIGYYFFKDVVSAENAMMAKLIGSAVALFIGLFFLKKAVPKELTQLESVDKRYKYWLSVSLPMFLIAGIRIVLSRTDIIMLGITLGKKEVGVYGAVIKVSALVLFGLQAVNLVLAPQISKLYHDDRKNQLQQIVTLGNRISFTIALIGVIVFIFLGKFILSFFGSSFTIGYNALLISVMAMLFNSFSGSTGYIMTMTGNQNVAAKILGLSAIVNIILNFTLIPTWGIEGAAVATGTSMILWNIIMIFYIKNKLKINATII